MTSSSFDLNTHTYRYIDWFIIPALILTIKTDYYFQMYFTIHCFIINVIVYKKKFKLQSLVDHISDNGKKYLSVEIKCGVWSLKCIFMNMYLHITF